MQATLTLKKLGKWLNGHLPSIYLLRKENTFLRKRLEQIRSEREELRATATILQERLIEQGQRVAQLEKKGSELERVATEDPLTGLVTRRGMFLRFVGEYEIVKREGKPMSFMMIDIDYFKRINDLIGHEGGDMVLEVLAEVVLKVFRKEDIVCRWGGEEFLIAMPHVDTQQAYQVAMRLREALREDERTYSDKLKVTLSIGISSIRFRETHWQTAFKYAAHRADKAMYLVKSRGRDNILILEEEEGKAEA